MEKKEEELNKKVNDTKDGLETEIKALAKQFGDTPTDEQKTQLNKYTQQANQKMQQLLVAARQEKAGYKGKLVPAGVRECLILARSRVHR